MLTAGCGNPTGPEAQGSYGLISIDGQPLPVTFPRDFPSADMRILVGSRLVLDENAGASVTWVQDWLDESGVPIPSTRSERTASVGVYSIQGTEIRFWGWDWTFFGTISGRTITVECNAYTAGLVGLSPCTLVYRR
jgi:hypothetical protein